MTRLVLRSVRGHAVTAGLTALVFAMTAFVYACLGSVRESLERALVTSGGPDNLLVLSEEARSESGSTLDRDATAIICSAAEPDPCAAEVAAVATLPREDGSPANVTVRGVDRQSFAIHGVRSDRAPEAGRGQAIVGALAARRFRGLAPGSVVRLGRGSFTVVAIFQAGGRAFDSEIWATADEVLDAFERREPSCVIVRAGGAGRAASLRAALEGDPRLKVKLLTEAEYYEAQRGAAGLIHATAFFVAAGLALAACMAAMNSMHAAVSARLRDFAVMRAIGFRASTVVWLVWAEALLVSLAGGAAGALAAWSIEGVSAGTMNWTTFSEVAFVVRYSPMSALAACGLSVAAGIAGGLLPALRAASRSPARALAER